MMAAENPREDCAQDDGQPPEPAPALLRIVRRSPTPPDAQPPACANQPLSEADWQLLFDAVKSRLEAAAARPDTLPVVVPECIEALEWLQGQLKSMRAQGH